MKKDLKDRTGNKNSQYGTMWIYNLTHEENKKIKKEALKYWEERGWIKGRINDFYKLKKEIEQKKYNEEHKDEIEHKKLMHKWDDIRENYDHAFYTFHEFMNGDWYDIQDYIKFRQAYKMDVRFFTYAFHGTRDVLDFWTTYLNLNDDIIYDKNMGNRFTLTPDAAKKAKLYDHPILPPYKNDWYYIFALSFYHSRNRILNGPPVKSREELEEKKYDVDDLEKFRSFFPKDHELWKIKL